MNFDLPKDRPHRRHNPLTNEWVLVSPHRAERPWQGKIEERAEPTALSYDPSCYLCPGNRRAGGLLNPRYRSTFVFDNDFGALRADSSPIKVDQDGKGLLVAASEGGICRVVCFSPRHDLTISQMDAEGVRTVVESWTEEYRTLG